MCRPILLPLVMLFQCESFLGHEVSLSSSGHQSLQRKYSSQLVLHLAAILFSLLHLETGAGREGIRRGTCQMSTIPVTTFGRALPQKSDPFVEEDEESSIDSSINAEPPFTIATHSVKVGYLCMHDLLCSFLFCIVHCICNGLKSYVIFLVL